MHSYYNLLNYSKLVNNKKKHDTNNEKNKLIKINMT